MSISQTWKMKNCTSKRAFIDYSATENNRTRFKKKTQDNNQASIWIQDTVKYVYNSDLCSVAIRMIS